MGPVLRSRSLAAIVVGVLLILPSDWFRDATARPGERCSPPRNPAQEIIYDTEEMTDTFRFDMKHCFPKGVFVSGVSVELPQITTEGYGSVDAWGMICKPNEKCRIRVSLDHPSVERSEYKFRVFYKARNGKNKRLDIGWMTCTSTVVLASCDS